MDEKKLKLIEDALDAEDMESAQAIMETEQADAADPVAEAVSALRGDLEAALESRLTALLDDALRVSRMSDEERAAYETSRRQSDLEERERRVLARELRAEAMELLERRGLPRDLADAIGYESREKMVAAVDALERAFRRAVQDAVEERLRGVSPAAGASAQGADDALLDDDAYYRLTWGSR